MPSYQSRPQTCRSSSRRRTQPTPLPWRLDWAIGPLQLQRPEACTQRQLVAEHWDVITMLDERACLPLYLIETKMGAHVAGWAGLVPPPQIFQGKGRRLGGGRKL